VLDDLLCRNSLHPRTGTGPCEDCRRNPDEGIVHIGVTASRKLMRELVPGHRVCSRCGTSKELNDWNFHRDKNGIDGRSSRCKECVNRYHREWKKSTGRDGRTAYRRRTLRNYNLTAQAFDAMLAGQGGRCAICRSPEPGAAEWAVDHDHSCCPSRKSCCGTCVRGLLCVRCNVGLSFFDDQAARIRAAAAYIESFQAPDGDPSPSPPTKA